jgi:hypothetical protein
MAITCLRRCGNSWITGKSGIGFLPPRDTGQHDALRTEMLQPTWQKENN